MEVKTKMGLITFILTIAGGAVAGWMLRGKAEKKPEYHSSGRDIDLEEE